MTGTAARKLAVGTGVAAAILIPAIQQLGHLGISQAAFAAQGDQTLRAEGYAFSIWGVIYLGLTVYAVRYARVAETAALRSLAWPAALATAGCGLWIVAASANLMGLTVSLILISAGAAITGLVRTAPVAIGADRKLALWPMALLAGWLTVAAPLNVVTVATAMGLIQPAAAWGLAAVALVVALGSAVALIARSWIYPIPIAWGLAAVYAAERSSKPMVALAAAGAALLMLVVAFAARRRADRSSGA